MTASFRTAAAISLALFGATAVRAPAQDSTGATDASLPKAELAPRFRGLVHLGEGEFGTTAQAMEAGLVHYDGQWVPKSKARKIRGWQKDAERIHGWEDAYKVRTRHYRIETDLPPHIVDLDIGPFLDATYQAYTEVFAQSFGLSGKATDKKFIRIYRSYSEYAANEPAGERTRPRTQPAFIVNGDQLVTFWDETDPDSFYQHVFHEGAHQFVKGLLPGTDLPKWLDEGLASLLESCTWSPSRGEVMHDGLVPVQRLSVARAILSRARVDGDGSLPRRLFLDIPDSEFQAREYALAATFVHYLAFRDSGRHKKAFAKFLRATNGSGNKPIETIWREATRTDFGEVAQGWRDHVMEMELPRTARWCLILPQDHDDLDLREGDRALSVDGVPVFDASHFRELWLNRPTDRAFELIVIREEHGPAGPGSGRRTVRVEIPAGAKIEIQVTGTMQRAFCLVD